MGRSGVTRHERAGRSGLFERLRDRWTFCPDSGTSSWKLKTVFLAGVNGSEEGTGASKRAGPGGSSRLFQVWGPPLPRSNEKQTQEVVKNQQNGEKTNPKQTQTNPTFRVSQ